VTSCTSQSTHDFLLFYESKRVKLARALNGVPSCQLALHILRSFRSNTHDGFYFVMPSLK
jgi:hypothetical protein